MWAKVAKPVSSLTDIMGEQLACEMEMKTKPLPPPPGVDEEVWSLLSRESQEEQLEIMKLNSDIAAAEAEDLAAAIAASMAEPSEEHEESSAPDPVDEADAELLR